MKSILVSIVAAVLLAGCAEQKEIGEMRAAAQVNACKSMLANIDGAMGMWATAEKKADGDTPTEDQLGKYFKDGMPSCPGEGTYTIGAVQGKRATCSIHGTAKDN
jgi:hypothetical protein